MLYQGSFCDTFKSNVVMWLVRLTAGASRQSHKGQCGSLWFRGARQKSYALNHTQKTGHYCSQSGWITISKPDRQENRMIGTLWWQLLSKKEDSPITHGKGENPENIFVVCVAFVSLWGLLVTGKTIYFFSFHP